MEYSQLIKDRYSVRKFSDQRVEEGTLSAILEAARNAPTAVNKQPQRILVLRDMQSMEQLKTCTPYTFNAPMALIVCCDRSEAWVRPYDNDNSGVVDASIVATHIMLSIHDIGLGTTWVGHFDPAALRDKFHIPPHLEAVAIFPLGYPAPDAGPAAFHHKRYPLEHTVYYEHF